MDRVSLEKLLSQGLSLADIGRRFGRHESTVAYWVQKYGLQAAHREKHAARGRLTREALESLTEGRYVDRRNR
jgi:transposase